MIDINVYNSIDEIDSKSYQDLLSSCDPPAYYDPRFLRAAEFSPLIPYEKSYYLVVQKESSILAFMPIYLQSFQLIDPFGLLAQSFPENPCSDQVLVSHIMHCCDTRILSRNSSIELYHAIFLKLIRICREEGIQHFAMLNVSDEKLIAFARQFDCMTNEIVVRYRVDLSKIIDLDHLISKKFPQKGRTEIRKQIRKFKESDAKVVIEEPPFEDLDEVGNLCHSTTARNGTPHYIPPRPLSKFIFMCGNLIRLISVYSGSERVGVGVLLLDKSRVHFWLGGMSYEKCSFSPYTIIFSEIYKFALENKYRWVECGRLNARIKKRLGLTSVPLYSIVNRETTNTQVATEIDEKNHESDYAF